ncbi:unnamed protein product, partial [Rotaria sp. Silwood2]
EQNDFYGWSFAYMNLHLTDPRRVLSNETSERSDLILLTRTSDVLFQAHSALLDMRFYTGKQFPSRNSGTGYKIIFIPFDNNTNRSMSYYEDFMNGFLTNPSGPDTYGRPVGLLVLKDGSLLFSEDGNNRLYQV